MRSFSISPPTWTTPNGPKLALCGVCWSRRKNDRRTSFPAVAPYTHLLAGGIGTVPDNLLGTNEGFCSLRCFLQYTRVIRRSASRTETRIVRRRRSHFRTGEAGFLAQTGWVRSRQLLSKFATSSAAG